MATPRGKALIGQSGGPTAVINQSLIGVVGAALQSSRISAVYGALHGIRGVLEENLIDLGAERRETLEAVAATPGSALRSVRKKPTREECERALAVFQAHDVRYFFYIGGNDSAETAFILNELAISKGYDVRLFHVPKTIDNDLCVTDHCPGYGSAAKFVACATLGDDLDNRSLPGIKINVIMGRHAGWLTAASTLAREREGDGPHLVYVPERVFDLERFVGDVERVNSKLGRCLISVSEGIHDAKGQPIYESKEVDSHGNVQLSGSGALGDWLAAQLKARLGAKLRVRADTYGYLQRSYAGTVSEVDAAEARAGGRTALEVAVQGDAPHGSIVIRRTGEGASYRASFERAELASVAKVSRALDARFLAGDSDIAPAFLDYVRPLVGSMPRTGRLEARAVPKKLGA